MSILMFLFFFCACNDNSDKLVKDTRAINNFKVDELIQELDFNISNYKNNIVIVKGIVKDINTLNNRKTVILKGNKQENTLIVCDMQDEQDSLIKTLELGDEVAIKGILKGSLKDVILLHCLIHNPTN